MFCHLSSSSAFLTISIYEFSGEKDKITANYVSHLCGSSAFSVYEKSSCIIFLFIFSFKKYFNWSYKQSTESREDTEKVFFKNIPIAMYLIQSFRKHTLKFHQTLQRSRQKFLICWIFSQSAECYQKCTELCYSLFCRNRLTLNPNFQNMFTHKSNEKENTLANVGQDTPLSVHCNSHLNKSLGFLFFSPLSPSKSRHLNYSVENAKWKINY